jgi:hypothetical protein
MVWSAGEARCLWEERDASSARAEQVKVKAAACAPERQPLPYHKCLPTFKGPLLIFETCSEGTRRPRSYRGTRAKRTEA